jgi:GA-binding protein transcription factor beta
MGISVL